LFFEFLLVLEVPIDGAFGKASGIGNMANRGSLIALHIEQIARMLQDGTFGFNWIAHTAKIPIGI
jgi:hypothetical protein